MSTIRFAHNTVQREIISLNTNVTQLNSPSEMRLGRWLRGRLLREAIVRKRIRSQTAAKVTHPFAVIQTDAATGCHGNADDCTGTGHNRKSRSAADCNKTAELSLSLSTMKSTDRSTRSRYTMAHTHIYIAESCTSSRPCGVYPTLRDVMYFKRLCIERPTSRPCSATVRTV